MDYQSLMSKATLQRFDNNIVQEKVIETKEVYHFKTVLEKSHDHSKHHNELFSYVSILVVMFDIDLFRHDLIISL